MSATVRHCPPLSPLSVTVRHCNHNFSRSHSDYAFKHHLWLKTNLRQTQDGRRTGSRQAQEKLNTKSGKAKDKFRTGPRQAQDMPKASSGETHRRPFQEADSRDELRRRSGLCPVLGLYTSTFQVCLKFQIFRNRSVCVRPGGYSV